MDFIKIDELAMPQLTMPSLHSHNYYELYFLHEGQRSFFLNNALYIINAPALLFIPPHIMHKTEGLHFKRTNIYITENYLTRFQKVFIEDKQLQIINFTTDQANMLLEILGDAAQLPYSHPHYVDLQKARFDFFMLKAHQFAERTSNSSVTLSNAVPSLVLNALNYLNNNYPQAITLGSLCKHLYTTQSTLLYNFRKHLNCSPMNYLFSLRITKVKEELTTTQKKIDEIAKDCGFTSGNYLSLVFKKREKITPMQYRHENRPQL